MSLYPKTTHLNTSPQAKYDITADIYFYLLFNKLKCQLTLINVTLYCAACDRLYSFNFLSEKLIINLHCLLLYSLP